MNPLEIRDVETLQKLDISTQEKIRLLFRLGESRSNIVKLLGIKYQVVFKACNPKYAPKRWVNVLTKRLNEERSTKVTEVEMVEEISTSTEVEVEAEA